MHPIGDALSLYIDVAGTHSRHDLRHSAKGDKLTTLVLADVLAYAQVRGLGSDSVSHILASLSIY
jgi:hypothetical protein